MQKCVAFFIDKIDSVRYTCSMIKKILTLSILLSLGINPSFAIENGEKEKDPSRVVVLYFGQEYPGCSGYLYEPRIVFTAAHCLLAPYPVTHVGLPNKNTGLSAAKVSVESVLLPDEYNKSSPYQNDFSVLILSKPILITNKIILLNEEIKNKIQNDKVQVKTAGYGEQNSSGTTRETIRDAHYLYATLLDISNEINITNPLPGSVCSGDSGGPNTIIYNNQEVYLGATSHGLNQPNCGRWSGGGSKILQFDPVYKFNTIINKAKDIVGPEVVVSEVKPTTTKTIVKKKCIKLKNNKCKK